MPNFLQEEAEILFKERVDKQKIFLKSRGEIIKKLESTREYPPGDRHHVAMGSTFETLASNEMVEGRTETEQQKHTREIIEYLFQNADLLTGKEKLSRPDFVSVVFDDNGRMIIDEIVEFKASASAFESKKLRQPQHSIFTVDRIVQLMNSMIAATSFADLEVVKSIGANEEERLMALLRVFTEIKDSEINQQISFAEKLKYHVKIPTGETITPTNLHLHIGSLREGGKHVSLWISHSSFTRKDCTNIIDHYQETP